MFLFILFLILSLFVATGLSLLFLPRIKLFSIKVFLALFIYLSNILLFSLFSFTLRSTAPLKIFLNEKTTQLTALATSKLSDDGTIETAELEKLSATLGDFLAATEGGSVLEKFVIEAFIGELIRKAYLLKKGSDAVTSLMSNGEISLPNLLEDSKDSALAALKKARVILRVLLLILFIIFTAAAALITKVNSKKSLSSVIIFGDGE